MTSHSLLLSVLGLLVVAGAAPAQQAPDRTRPPELGPTPELRLPPVQRFTLSNGLPVLFLEKHGVPLVQIDVQIQAGAVADPAGKSGLASLTAAMLDEGAGSRSALEIADAAEFLGAQLTTGAGQHTSAVQLHTPVARVDSGLALLADVLLRPAFPAEELERQRKERLTGLTQWRDQPRAIAGVTFSQVLFGASHPYGRQTIGDAASIGAITTSDLKSFYQSQYRPGNATIIVVGDLTLDRLKGLLEPGFGTWSGAATPPPPVPPAKQVTTRQVILVDKPGAAQSEIRIGRIGVARKSPDYFPLVVMNTILGGSFTSRLNQNLREEHGYTYGAFSAFDFRPAPGPFIASAAVQTDVTDKALVEFMKELKAITDSITPEDVTKAKNYVALGFPSEFQSVANIASRLGELVTYGLPDDYLNTYIQHVMQVSIADVRRVARQYIDPARVAIIVVGDRAKIEPGIRALKLGEIRLRTVDDVLGKLPVTPGT